MTSSTCSYQIRTIEPTEWPALARMYETFEPKRVFFGLPPLHHSEDWLARISATCQNLVVIVNGQFAGHGVICKEGHDAEFAIFIHQGYRRMGLGRKLLGAIIAEARRLEVRLLWGDAGGDNQAMFHLTDALGFSRDNGVVYLRLGEREVEGTKERAA
jgi:GNAT superfamily N-acetyltransferase